MKKLRSGPIAIGLLLVAASCSSGSGSSSTAASVTVGSSATGDTTAPVGGADTSGLDDVHAQVYTMALAVIADKAVTVDDACVKAIIAQLSAADAKLIVDAGPTGSPTLSASGEALGAKLPGCTITPTT